MKAVLFDLDGTLIDSAPDLAAALNLQRQQRNLPPMEVDKLRNAVSQGVRGMIDKGLNIKPNDPNYEDTRQEFLHFYAKNLTTYTQLFSGIDRLLNYLEQENIAWGIVTNKLTQYTLPIIKQLKLENRTEVVICGDTTPHSKPHPAPLLYAAQALNIEPQACWYVGDDLRDIQAGQSAGMKTIAVSYGYGGTEQEIAQWGADFIVNSTNQLLMLLIEHQHK